MKKNYIKPVSKTVIAEMAVAAMDVVASEKGIGYKGDGSGVEADAPERPKEQWDDQSSNTYSLW